MAGCHIGMTSLCHNGMFTTVRPHNVTYLSYISYLNSGSHVDDRCWMSHLYRHRYPLSVRFGQGGFLFSSERVYTPVQTRGGSNEP